MVCIHIKHYPKLKDLIHPNITNNIDYYRNGNLYILPIYHDCSLRNRNGLKKVYIIVEVISVFCRQINLTGKSKRKIQTTKSLQHKILVTVKYSILSYSKRSLLL